MSLKRLMPVQPLPVFLVPRYGEVRFLPTGDVPLRDTNVWRVLVTHTSPGRRNRTDIPPKILWYPAEYAGGNTPYPTAEIARFYMLKACAIADGKPEHSYSDAQQLPPLNLGLSCKPDPDGLPSDAQIKQWTEKEGEMHQQHAEAGNYGGDERTVSGGLVHPDGCKCNLCQFDGDKRGI